MGSPLGALDINMMRRCALNKGALGRCGGDCVPFQRLTSLLACGQELWSLWLVEVPLIRGTQPADIGMQWGVRPRFSGAVAPIGFVFNIYNVYEG